MSSDLDISEIIQRTPDEFNLTFSLDVTRMQKLFEALCLVVRDMQSDMKNVKKEIKAKADESSLSPMRDNIAQNTETLHELIEKFDDLRSLFNEKVTNKPPKTTPLKERNVPPPPPPSPKSLVGDDDQIKALEERINKIEDKLKSVKKKNKKLRDIIDDLKDAQNKDASENVAEREPEKPEKKDSDVYNGDENDKMNDKEKDEDDSRKNNTEFEKVVVREKEQEKNAPLSRLKEINNKPENDMSLSSDNLMSAFLDAAKIEIGNVKNEILDELNKQIKETNATLNGNINKAAADSENRIKQANDLIIDTEAKLRSELKAVDGDQKNKLHQFALNIESLGDKLENLYNRVEANAKAADMNKENLQKIVADDGSLDTEKLIEQIQGLIFLVNDAEARIASLENREYVTPEALNSLTSTISQLDEKTTLNANANSNLNLKVNDLKETIFHIRDQFDGQASNEQIGEIENLSQGLKDEISTLRNALVKSNKDIINIRAAINTLRSHSEDTKSISDDAKIAALQACEDVEAVEGRIKKVIGFIQNETSNLDNQIKDLGRITDRNESAICEIQRQLQMAVMQTTPKPKTSQARRKVVSDSKPPAPAPATTPASTPTPSPSRPATENTAAQPTHPDNNVKPTTIIINGTSGSIVNPTDQQEQGGVEVYNIPININTPEKMVHADQSGVRKRSAEVIENTTYRQVARHSANLPRLGTPSQARKEIDSIRNDLKKYDELFPRLEKTETIINSLKNVIDQLNKNYRNLSDSKADRSELQKLFEQFRAALAELNNRLGGMRKQMANKADITEIRDLQKALVKDVLSQGETAAGTETVRCLMCGQPRNNVTGTIDDPAIIKAIGNAFSTRVTGADSDGNVCFVYGEHGEMFLGRSPDGKPILSHQVSSRRESVSDADSRTSSPPPLTAPMITRQILEVPPLNTPK